MFDCFYLIIFFLIIDTIYKLEDESEEVIDEMGPAEVMNDLTPNSKARREEIVKRLQKGMLSPKVQVIDISAVFDGHKKIEHLFTGAFANSLVDLKSQGALFYKNNHEQMNAVFKITKPSTVPLNFQEALNHEIKVIYEADFKYGTSDKIHFQGSGERSEAYTDQLRNDPLGKQCLQETSKNNFYQKDCYQMIIKAQAPDHFKGKLTYDSSDNEERLMLQTLIDTYHTMYQSWYNIEAYEELSRFKAGGVFEIEAKAEYYDNLINYKFANKYGALRLLNVDLEPYYPYAMAIYAPLTNWERSRNWFTDNQNLREYQFDFFLISTALFV